MASKKKDKEFEDEEQVDTSVVDFDRDIWPIILRLKHKYRAYKYNMLTMNCNHFSDELLRILFSSRRSLPNWCNRAAYLGSFFRCIVPRKFVTVTPADFKGDTFTINASWRKEDDETDASDYEEEYGLIDNFYYSLSSEPKVIRPLGDFGDDI